MTWPEDPSQLFDIDMDQLARPSSFIASRRLEPKPTKLAHPDPGQDPRDRRDSHA
jgi:hypothetical protein